jgi:hypothetical protein
LGGGIFLFLKLFFMQFCAKKISSLVLVWILSLPVVLPVYSAPSGGGFDSSEALCFKHLNDSMEDSSIFSDIKLDKLEKINQNEQGGDDKSKKFSIETYDEFKEMAQLPVPVIPSEIDKYPNKLGEVDPAYLTPQREKYRANRTNVAMVQYKNNQETNLGDIDGDGKTDSIRGYFIDSQAVTFGERSAFQFPFRAREPQSTRKYPHGEPYDDFREYVVYTHHLAPKYGGDLVSCGIVKMTPEEGFVKYSQSADVLDLSVNNYGGDVFEGSSYKTSKIDDDFLKSDIRLQTVAVQDDYKRPFMRYDVLSVSYNNQNDFFNEYITMPIQEAVMTDPAVQAAGTVTKLTEVYYAALKNTGLGIAGGGSGLASASLMANVIGADTSQEQGGLALYEGVPFELFEEVQKIPDEGLRFFMNAALAPGVSESFAMKPESERSRFEQDYLDSDINYDRRIENVAYALDIVGGGENLTPQNLRFKDLDFGGAIVPYEDVRVQGVENAPFFETAIESLEMEKEAELLALGEPENEQDRVRIQLQKEEIERNFVGKVETLMTLEEDYRDLQLERLDIQNQYENGELSDGDKEAKLRAVRAKADELFVIVQAEDLMEQTMIEDLGESLVSAEPVVAGVDVAEPVTISSDDSTKNSIYVLWGGIALLLAVILIFWGLRKR